ncbi:MAG: hypothetical protein UHK60_09360, partial [Acutalibacteraceae bacterium]|nr:hypothetical protein [Acutalibacteraceae bacterium]
GNGGNFGSVYNLVANNPTSGAKNLEWEMTQGYAFGLFDIDQPEILTSESDTGAYMSILANKMSSCFDGLSKTMAMYLYGGKFGVIDQVKDKGSGITIAASNTFELTSAGALKMDVGTRFVIATASTADKAVPGSDLLGSNSTPVIFTVTAIDDKYVTASASVTGGKVYNGDYIELYSARSGSEARGFEGLADLIPTIADRVKTDTRWTSYIKTAFRGVDRSVNADRLAGQFVKAEATGDTRLTDTLVTLLKKTKRAGGLNNMIIINDETWEQVGKELGLAANMRQLSNVGSNKNKATFGVSELATAFGDAFIDRTVIDPYCTEGTAYSIEKDDLAFYDLGNVSKVLSPVSNGQMGKYDIKNVGEQGIGTEPTAKLNMDKLFTITPGAAGEYGPAFTISANVYGNFMLRKTASAGVAVLK